MKKNIVLLALLLGVFTFANTNEVANYKQTNSLETGRYGYAQPLKFIERGVEFFVFPNGEFDFNTHPRHHRSRGYGHGVSINISHGAPRSFRASYHGNHHSDRGVRIEHDHLGRVRRIGSVFINYDSHSRIKRIGSVYMNYHHHLLANIGGLHIYYSRNGRIHRTTGAIKHSMGCHFCGVNNCSTNHYGNNHGHNNHDNYNDSGDYNDYGNYDDDLYYYRKGNKKHKKNKR
ncbi:MAG: hypothetical protein HRT69_06950 [Flavobacteriaceae bacterium]|nr:hypothetical protein [Flavobacteriaceae bacterium]